MRHTVTRMVSGLTGQALLLCALLAPAPAMAYDAIIDHLERDGDEYYYCSGDGDHCDNYGTISTNVDGGAAYYSFDVSEWKYWITRIRLSVRYSGVDAGSYGDVWPRMYVQRP
jgi:hypothetical protein